MKESEIGYEVIQERLEKVPCPVRFYPFLVAALDIFVQRDFSSEVQQKISNKIGHHVGMGWSDQFTRDFETYGLYEAILYFHSYPFTRQAESFINEACDLYCEIASQYMAHQESIENSDDPRIQSKLGLLAFRGATHRHTMSYQRAPLQKTRLIEAPVKPPADAKYERKLPINRDMLMVFKQSEIDDPGNSAAEAIEHLDARFMFSDFPGIQLVFFEIAKLLEQLEIDPFSAAGQYVLQEIIEHIEDEFYGDFDRWLTCITCGKDFTPEISLASANRNLLQGGWACENCRPSLD